jgi:hypothetical protein
LAKGKQVSLKKIDLVKTLGVPSKKVIEVLAKSLGSQVTKGEVIAKSKGLFKKNELVSPVTGTLESLSEDGVLKIKIAQDEYEVKIPLAGKVTAITGDRVEISFPAQKIVGIWGAGGQAFGSLTPLGSEDKETTVFDLKESLKGKIVAFSGTLTHGFWYKAITCGIAGIVCGKLPNEQFGKKLETDSLLVPGGKKENVLPLLVAGDKEGLIKEEIWQVLVNNQEKTVVVNGKERCLFIPK